MQYRSEVVFIIPTIKMGKIEAFELYALNVRGVILSYLVQIFSPAKFIKLGDIVLCFCMT